MILSLTIQLLLLQTLIHIIKLMFLLPEQLIERSCPVSALIILKIKNLHLLILSSVAIEHSLRCVQNIRAVLRILYDYVFP